MAPYQIALVVQNKVCQVMACGIPVITRSLGAEGIDAVHQKELLNANNTNQYMEIIEQLTDPRRYQVVANAAIARIEMDYSWDGQLKLLNQLVTPEESPLVDIANATGSNPSTDSHTNTSPPCQCA